MNNAKKSDLYEETKVLKEILKQLKGRKFHLDCGHRVTFGHFLGNSIIVFNKKEPEIICTLCGY